jgi:hypothetical protein
MRTQAPFKCTGAAWTHRAPCESIYAQANSTSMNGRTSHRSRPIAAERPRPCLRDIGGTTTQVASPIGEHRHGETTVIVNGADAQGPTSPVHRDQPRSSSWRGRADIATVAPCETMPIVSRLSYTSAAHTTPAHTSMPACSFGRGREAVVADDLCGHSVPVAASRWRR